jgi:nitrogen regulatory protein PII
MAMKMITAVIRPHKLDDLELAVAQLGVRARKSTRYSAPR